MGQSGSKFIEVAGQAVKMGNETRLRALLEEYKQYIDTQDASGDTLLKTAVMYNQPNVVKLLVEEGADVNVPDSHGMICLHYAVHAENEEIVKLLLDRGSYMNGRNENYETPLSVAVAKKHLPIVNMLLEKQANVNISDSLGNTPLHIAATIGDTELISHVLQKGRDVELNCKNIEGYTPLMIAIKNQYEEIAMQITEQEQTDISICGADRIPPITAAINHGFLRLVLQLVEKGVDVNALTPNKITPLVMAIENGYEAIAMELISAGASASFPSYPKDEGVSCSPIHVAVKKHMKSVVERLIENGANVNICNQEGLSPLLIAIHGGDSEMVSLLIDRGTSKEELRKGLRQATAMSSKDILKRLLAAVNKDDLLQFLLEVGMDINGKTQTVEEDKDCAVCLEVIPDAVVIPCGHATCCYSCLCSLPSPKVCPICRIPISNVQRIYRK
eukprot:TRINITY_DN6040_c0_g1_i1.p1 TRINITY_DN6040_c0_g1~~TRINITY_DN6040_c0_g1_i1.p1  ORF type:complete len:446 (+),score=101.20 TRINITY_DN6040_c0_g1_i1:181-1518(+)